MADNDAGTKNVSLDKFEPNPDKVTTSKSATKRVALFIFIAAGAVFMLVSIAIQDSGNRVRSSSAPREIVRPAVIPSRILPPAPQRTDNETRTPEPEPQPQTQTPEPEQVNTEPETQPVRIQPVYVHAPRRVRTSRPITSVRRQSQALRLQAASAPSTIAGFGNGSGSNANTPAAGVAPGNNNPSETVPSAPESANNPADLMNAMNNALNGNNSDSNNPDPNGWARKQAFLKQSLPAEYSQHTRAFPVSALELKAGALLPCVLISGLNSDLPGNMIAQVSENVYDNATGRYLLIPRGSRLIGTYDHQINAGQNRVLVIWSRLIFPDGSSLMLDNLQGADQSGYSGFKGRVNRHLNVMITSALLVSLIGAGVEAASPSNSGSVFSNNNDKSVGSILRERTANAIADVLTQVVRQGLNRQPTIIVKPGYRFMIFVQHDVVFPKVWNDRTGR